MSRAFHVQRITSTTCDPEVVDDPGRIASQVAQAYGTVVVLKASDRVIAALDAQLLHYGGGGTGFAIAGSGDVLAGAIRGLLSRGVDAATYAVRSTM